MVKTVPAIPKKSRFMPDMEGKVVLINGGTRGIGLSVARLAAGQGAQVYVVGRHEADIDYPLIQADLTSEREAEGVFKMINPPDYVFNNVGYYFQKEIAETSLSEFIDVIQSNIVSMFLLTRAALRHANGGATIVNMSSRPALSSYKSWSAYFLSKQAVIPLTQAAAEEGEARNIKAYAVCPSRVDTAFRDRLFPHEDKSTRLSPEDVAQTVIYLMNRTMPNGSHYWIKQYG